MPFTGYTLIFGRFHSRYLLKAAINVALDLKPMPCMMASIERLSYFILSMRFEASRIRRVFTKVLKLQPHFSCITSDMVLYFTFTASARA